MIKVGYCVAYDWKMLQHSIPQIYEEADLICLSVDRNRQSWLGVAFSWDEEGFRALIDRLDVAGKIKVYEDVFYNPSLLPMQNEVAQRNKIASFMGEGGWHIQLDADEYFVDFSAFVTYLRKFRENRRVNICCPMINLYKQIPEGMLWIKPNSFRTVEYFPIATRFPHYEYGRRNGYFNILTDFSILHQSWARSEKEIWEKLNNWGHAKDFDVMRYFKLWQEVSAENYTQYKNFHHLHPHTWPALAMQQGINISEDILQIGKSDFLLPISPMDLRKANSIWLSRTKKIWSKLTR